MFPAIALAAVMFVAGGPRLDLGRSGHFRRSRPGDGGEHEHRDRRVAALGIVGICLGRFRTAVLPLVPAAVAYLMWLIANPGGGTSSLGLSGLLGCARARCGRWWRPPWPAPFLSRLSLGPALALLVVGAAGGLDVRGRLGPFEAVWLLTAVIWMTMTIVTRVVPGPISPAAARYGYVITWLLVPGGRASLAAEQKRRGAVGGHRRRRVGRLRERRPVQDGAGLVGVGDLRGAGPDSSVAILAAAGEPAVEESSTLSPTGRPDSRSMTVGWVRQCVPKRGLGAGPRREAVTTSKWREASCGWRSNPGCGGRCANRSEVGESLGVRTTGYPTIGLRVGARTDVDISYVDRYGSGSAVSSSPKTTSSATRKMPAPWWCSGSPTARRCGSAGRAKPEGGGRTHAWFGRLDGDR